MTISVVQVSNSSGVFGAGVTAGNSIVLIPLAFDFGNTVITSSAPTLGGSAFTGASDLLDVPSGFSTGSGVVYGGFWLLPNIPGGSAGATATGITIGGGGTLFALYALEVAGLGASPSLDQTANGHNGNAVDPAAGPTPAITAAPELIAGFGILLGAALASPSGGWTATAGPSSFAYIGYQVATSSGGTYSWAQSSSGSANAWSAGIVTIKGSAAAAAATPAPLVVPQAAVMQAANW